MSQVLGAILAMEEKLYTACSFDFNSFTVRSDHLRCFEGPVGAKCYIIICLMVVTEVEVVVVL